MSALLRRHLLALTLAGLLGASAQAAETNKDPFEGFNRSVYSFNQTLDDVALRPLAEGYQKVVPELVRTGVSNFFGNLGDAWSVVNHLLQGKGGDAATMGFRVATNTLLGFGGLLDPATEFGMERQTEDFGQTLGRWGVPPGPYVMLPVLGASTLRDTVATPVDWQASPSTLVDGNVQIASVLVLQAVSVRAGYMGATQMLDDIALDKYSFFRDAYLARRRNQVYDGNPPEEAEPAE